GIGYICDMFFAVGQIVHKPGIYCAKSQVSFGCKRLCTFYIVQYPMDLGGRKISVDQQSCFFLYGFSMSFLTDLLAIVGGTSILPYNGIVDRFAGLLVPYDGRLPLVGDADCFYSVQFSL